MIIKSLVRKYLNESLESQLNTQIGDYLEDLTIPIAIQQDEINHVGFLSKKTHEHISIEDVVDNVEEKFNIEHRIAYYLSMDWLRLHAIIQE